MTVRLALAFLVATAPAWAAPPEVLDDRFELTLFAEHPSVRTPVGCTIDGFGRLLVIESHTHFRPKDYDGPKTDRILALSDTDGDGKADKTEVFYEGGKHTMSILWSHGDDLCYVATRSRIFVLSDTDDDGVADSETELLRLETTGDYPHNGLCGLAIATNPSPLVTWNGDVPNRPLVHRRSSQLDGVDAGTPDPPPPAPAPRKPEPAPGKPKEPKERVVFRSPPPAPDWIYFGLGENLGHPYKIITKQGETFEGGGEGGNIFQVHKTGNSLYRIATGFWNPFGICVANSEIFTVDNDPDARPPNRLLHVVRGGDYGYQFRYGRPGTHPLQCWNGEIPGTLPMIAGTGEAACSIMPYDRTLWVTSWGHHRIESYELEPLGATYSAKMKTIVRGDENFRPVGLARGTGNAVFFTDWVDKSYPIHGKGRVWKLAPKTSTTNDLKTIPPPKTSTGSLSSPDPFLRARAVGKYVRQIGEFVPRWEGVSDGEKFANLAVIRGRGGNDRTDAIRRALADPSADVNLVAVRWVSDEKIAEFNEELYAIARRSTSHPRLFDATVATLKRLGADTSKLDREAILMSTLMDNTRSAAERVAALRRVGPQSKKLPLETFETLIASPSENLSDSAVWHLTQRQGDGARALLKKIAADPETGGEARADALMALAEQATIAKQPTQSLAQWMSSIGGGKGNARAGRRVFFGKNGALCSRCHTHGGYGKAVGPDLTGIGSREEIPNLVESIINPNKEIAPMYRPWMIEKNDGELLVGLEIEVTGRHGTGALTLIGVDGNSFEVALSDIKSRDPWVASLMPAGLDTRLSAQEMRDLIAFLNTSP